MRNTKKKIRRSRSSGYRIVKRGFTLIELLIVIAIVGVLTGIGFVSLGGFTEGQKVDTEAQEFYTAVQLARSRAQTQVKPTTGTCATEPLDGYSVTLTCDGRCTGYAVQAVCGGTPHTPEVEKAFPDNISVYPFGDFENSRIEVLFQTLTGKAEGISGEGKIIFSNDAGNSYGIEVNEDGTVFFSSDEAAALAKITTTPTPTPTNTPTPSLTPTPTNSPTPTQPPPDCGTGSLSNYVCIVSPTNGTLYGIGTISIPVTVRAAHPAGITQVSISGQGMGGCPSATWIGTNQYTCTLSYSSTFSSPITATMYPNGFTPQSVSITVGRNGTNGVPQL